MAEQTANAERYFCPECGRYTDGPNDLCSGGRARVSFLDAKHPPNVRPERDVLPDERNADA